MRSEHRLSGKDGKQSVIVSNVSMSHLHDSNRKVNTKKVYRNFTRNVLPLPELMLTNV